MQEFYHKSDTFTQKKSSRRADQRDRDSKCLAELTLKELNWREERYPRCGEKQHGFGLRPDWLGKREQAWQAPWQIFTIIIDLLWL